MQEPIHRNHDEACRNTNRRKRTADKELPQACEGETTIISKGSSYTVKIMREDPDLTTHTTSVCRERLPGYDLLQLEKKYGDYDGSE